MDLLQQSENQRMIDQTADTVVNCLFDRFTLSFVCLPSFGHCSFEQWTHVLAHVNRFHGLGKVIGHQPEGRFVEAVTQMSHQEDPFGLGQS